MFDPNQILRIATAIMGWHEKTDGTTPYPRVSVQHGSYVLIENGTHNGDGRRHYAPHTSLEDAINLLTFLPKSNAIITDETRGFRVAGGDWAGQWSESLCTAVVSAAVNYLDTKDVVPTTYHLRMARASQSDFDDTLKFLTQMDLVLEYGYFEGEEEDEREWLDEEATALKIGKWVLENRRLLFGWERVVWGFDTLLREVCDPNLSYLDYKPDLAVMKAWARATDADQKNEASTDESASASA